MLLRNHSDSDDFMGPLSFNPGCGGFSRGSWWCLVFPSKMVEAESERRMFG